MSVTQHGHSRVLNHVVGMRILTDTFVFTRFLSLFSIDVWLISASVAFLRVCDVVLSLLLPVLCLQSCFESLLEWFLRLVVFFLYIFVVPLLRWG